VFLGRLWVRIKRSRSAAAVLETSTRATRLEIVQVYRPTGFGVFETLMGPLQSPRQAIQEGGYVARIWVGFVKRLRKK
jgi:hypothetical protein